MLSGQNARKSSNMSAAEILMDMIKEAERLGRFFFWLNREWLWSIMQQNTQQLSIDNSFEILDKNLSLFYETLNFSL